MPEAPKIDVVCGRHHIDGMLPSGYILRPRQAIDRPILLHEQLHAFHDQQLPSGFASADIEKFYQRGQTAGWPPGSTMMSNHKEFFATTASEYLYGDIPRPPESRKQLRAKQPQYYQWLADLFDDGRARS